MQIRLTEENVEALKRMVQVNKPKRSISAEANYAIWKHWWNWRHPKNEALQVQTPKKRKP